MSQLISLAGLDVRDGADGEKDRDALETHIPADSDHVEPTYALKINLPLRKLT